MWFTPSRALGLAVGMGLLALLLAASAVCLVLVSSLPVNLLTFFLLLVPLGCIPLVAVVVYRLYGLATARYHLDRNGLRIEWGASLEVIPIAQIHAARTGADLNADLLPVGFWWPGCVVGRADVRGLGSVEFFAASNPAEMVLVSTATRHFAISPGDPDRFLRLFRDEDRMGALETWPPVSRRPSLLPQVIWADFASRTLLVASAMLVLSLLAALTTLFPDLPSNVPLHFDPAGRVDRAGSAARLFILPVIGGGAWALNLLVGVSVFRRDRFVARGLWAASIGVALLTWLAAFQLLGA